MIAYENDAPVATVDFVYPEEGDVNKVASGVGGGWAVAFSMGVPVRGSRRPEKSKARADG